MADRGRREALLVMNSQFCGRNCGLAAQTAPLLSTKMRVLT
jgi:hypothetical protein